MQLANGELPNLSPRRIDIFGERYTLTLRLTLFGAPFFAAFRRADIGHCEGDACKAVRKGGGRGKIAVRMGMFDLTLK